MTATALPALNDNQLAVLDALHDKHGEGVGRVGAQDVRRKIGEPKSISAIYGTLRSLRDRGLITEKKTRTGATPKGDRFGYRLTTQGREARVR